LRGNRDPLHLNNKRGGEINDLVVATSSAVKGSVPFVSNLFRIGIFTRCDSTKSTPSMVSLKSALSARVMYPLF